MNGVARMQNLTSVASELIYDETIVVPGGGYTATTQLLLPSSGSYQNRDLRFYRNGKLLEVAQEFEYVGAGPDRTYVELNEAVGAGERLRFVISGNPLAIYDEVLVVPGTDYAAGEILTLPLSQTYNDIDLQVYLDGQFLEAGIDYNYVGSAPRTQIQTVVDFFRGERVRFRIEG